MNFLRFQNPASTVLQEYSYMILFDDDHRLLGQQPRFTCQCLRAGAISGRPTGISSIRPEVCSTPQHFLGSDALAMGVSTLIFGHQLASYHRPLLTLSAHSQTPAHVTQL